jgi:monoamine oxidase
MSRSLYAILARRYGPKVDPMERRRFLAATLATGAGLLLSMNPASGALSRLTSRAGKRVVVVGAGFSGLACAYELKSAGYDVSVIEATNRVGGRVFSMNKLGTEFIPGRNVEFGGELIGSNHPAWVAYADKFKLEFLDVTENEEWDFPVIVDGKRLTGEESNKLYEELDATLSTMNDDARAVLEAEPWNTPKAAELDARTLKSWIDSRECSELCKKAILAQLEGDNGQAADKQSYLGNLAQVKGGQVEKYWTDSEIYRCKGGNQLLAYALAKELGDRVTTKLPVTAIERKGDAMIVTCADNRTLECDDVVMAVSPAVWSKIDLKGMLPRELNPQIGTNIKYFSHMKSRYWAAAKTNATALTNADITWTWDGTDNQEGDENVCLSAFSGGPAALRARARQGEELKKAYTEALSAILPGYSDYVVSTKLMDWPSMPYVNGGYSFPAPGQVTTVGPMMAKGLGGKVHFAGEATCYKFVGYMEGALSSGVSVARRLAVRDGVAK